jgi:hypothetical protein
MPPTTVPDVESILLKCKKAGHKLDAVHVERVGELPPRYLAKLDAALSVADVTDKATTFNAVDNIYQTYLNDAAAEQILARRRSTQS